MLKVFRAARANCIEFLKKAHEKSTMYEEGAMLKKIAIFKEEKSLISDHVYYFDDVWGFIYAKCSHKWIHVKSDDTHYMVDFQYSISSWRKPIF